MQNMFLGESISTLHVCNTARMAIYDFTSINSVIFAKVLVSKCIVFELILNDAFMIKSTHSGSRIHGMIESANSILGSYVKVGGLQIFAQSRIV